MRWLAARNSITLWLLATLLLQACHASPGAAVVVEWRPAVKAGLSASECELLVPVRDTSVALPSGARVDVRFEVENAIAFTVTSETKLVMRDITASNPAGAPSWEVVLFPEDTEANRIKHALRSKPSCYWLVSVGGNVVQLEFSGERGDSGISGGLFPSLDSALLAYGRTKDEISVEAQSSPEEARAQAFWLWRRKMDLWEIACDPELQRAFRERDATNFDRLRATLDGIDCSAKPIRPDDDAVNGADRD